MSNTNITANEKDTVKSRTAKKTFDYKGETDTHCNWMFAILCTFLRWCFRWGSKKLCHCVDLAGLFLCFSLLKLAEGCDGRLWLGSLTLSACIRFLFLSLQPRREIQPCFRRQVKALWPYEIEHWTTRYTNLSASAQSSWICFCLSLWFSSRQHFEHRPCQAVLP